MENISQVPVYQHASMNTVNKLRSISSQQFTIIDNFLPDQDYEYLLNLAKDRYDQGKFRKALVGNTKQATLNQKIRSDQICWLEDFSPIPAMNHYYNAMNELIEIFNREFYLGLTEFEAHFAVYQAGDFYRKHVDQFKNTQERRISCVYYLNPQWNDANGGELQLYDQQDNKLATVAPLGNRLACFDSSLPHEVYPTNQTRYSITCWLKTRPFSK